MGKAAANQQLLKLEPAAESGTNKQDALYAAVNDRFNMLHKYGLSEAKDADDFFRQRALIEREAKPENRTMQRNWMEKLFVPSAELLVGGISGLGIDKMINPDGNYLYLAFALFIGVSLSVLYLFLIKQTSYDAIVRAQKDDKSPQITALVLMGVYMLIEASLNYEGLIKISAQRAAQVAAEASGKPVGEPQLQYPLLLLAMGLIAFATYANLIKGRQLAMRDSIANDIARMKMKDEFAAVATAIDRPAFLKRNQKSFRI